MSDSEAGHLEVVIVPPGDERLSPDYPKICSVKWVTIAEAREMFCSSITNETEEELAVEAIIKAVADQREFKLDPEPEHDHAWFRKFERRRQK